MRTRCRLGFTGALRDAAMPGYLLGNGYRIYLPSLMRLNALDNLSPFGAGGLNAYAYSDDDPIDRMDPTGHMNIDLGELDALQSVFAHSDTRSRPPATRLDEFPRDTDRPIAAENSASPKGSPTTKNPSPKPSTPTAVVAPSLRPPLGSERTYLAWRRDPVTPIERAQRIQAAQSLLENPPLFDEETFNAVPPVGWLARGYQQTLTLEWTVLTEQTPMRVLAHVHYAWENGAWKKFAGHAWIPGVKNWQYRTPEAVVDLARDIPPPPSRVGWP
ncbi:RHS repeat-associated core domain-containing protein [Trinickia sp. NRRL B-1857]|uniref:RHS repeat-associated core domain-containing protein n=1 Tax=Trinickia sp. NRRL B-1857 TaxID=3162879 RepID=UPI003D2D4735